MEFKIANEVISNFDEYLVWHEDSRALLEYYESDLRRDMEVIEKRVKEGWIQQARRVDDGLDELVDEFSVMIDEIKNELKEKMKFQQERLRNQIEELIKTKHSFIKATAIIRQSRSKPLNTTRFYVKQREEAKTAKIKIEKEEISQEEKNLKELHVSESLDLSFQPKLLQIKGKMEEIKKMPNVQFPATAPNYLSLQQRIHEKIDATAPFDLNPQFSEATKKPKHHAIN